MFYMSRLSVFDMIKKTIWYNKIKNIYIKIFHLVCYWKWYRLKVILILLFHLWLSSYQKKRLKNYIIVHILKVCYMFLPKYKKIMLLFCNMLALLWTCLPFIMCINIAKMLYLYYQRVLNMPQLQCISETGIFLECKRAWRGGRVGRC